MLAANSPASAVALRAVYLVRHAEKDGDALSATGRKQADKLADLLKNSGVTSIYTSQFERTRQTAAPVKAALEAAGSHVQILSLDLPTTLLEHPEDASLLASYGRSAVQTLQEKSPDEIVLIVGHDVTIPAILLALGYASPVRIDPTEFDRLFQLIPRAAGSSPGFWELTHYA
ncbi:phosphoglycerate mutase family protein [Paludisphaera rhizosphaerae]|uniref:phosphoglycerate mutase family protein n=1 Tax=Paludisphaera rhizosphaerae TaxID=2711216 RepID=UPI0013ED4D4D|nr:phosphoglycerate mutase family protein [Paludisphaera rhizosphaerae]